MELRQWERICDFRLDPFSPLDPALPEPELLLISPPLPPLRVAARLALQQRGRDSRAQPPFGGCDTQSDRQDVDPTTQVPIGTGGCSRPGSLERRQRRGLCVRRGWLAVIVEC